jgi:uncharacterized protein YndB with AHSA1/START domain
MPTQVVEETVQTIRICQEIEIAAPIDIAFEAILAEAGPESTMPDGTPMPFVLEAWPGGRWFRDLGNHTGHLWGHVQVIKPPKLLELSGPMFMSYPAINFVQYRLTAEGLGTRLQLTHRALGLIPTEHREGVQEGWKHGIQRIREIAAKLAASRGVNR